jgi:hypothetical protein
MPPSRTATGRPSAGWSRRPDPDALIISETWQKDSTLLRMLRGDRADTTMNYRLRDAVLGLLTPGKLRLKGFADSGRQIIAQRVRLAPGVDPGGLSRSGLLHLMNLLDSHDTERCCGR